MAIQIITHKKIKKYDTKNPNFDPESLKKPKKENYYLNMQINLQSL